MNATMTTTATLASFREALFGLDYRKVVDLIEGESPLPEWAGGVEVVERQLDELERCQPLDPQDELWEQLVDAYESSHGEDS